MMRWSLDPQGSLAHTNLEWKRFTGLSDKETLGQSTRLPSVHYLDQPVVGSIIQNSVKIQSSFLIMFRLLNAKKDYSWVMAGAAPAFSPADGTLIGYLGSTEILEAEPQSLKALDVMHTVPQRSRHPVIMLDAIAEHIMTARNLALASDDLRAKKILDSALLSIGDLLFKSSR